MTSDIGVDRVEEGVEFLFHCSCGATIKMSGYKETCGDCGSTVEVVRRVSTPDGSRYKLRIGRHPNTTTRPTQYLHEVPEKRLQTLGLILLLLAVFPIIAYSVPQEKFHQWAALADTPKPRDCAWTSTPSGNKHCHYVSSFRHVTDSEGEHIIVEWRRVNDWD